jgi:hypothetical protein
MCLAVFYAELTIQTINRLDLATSGNDKGIRRKEMPLV